MNESDERQQLLRLLNTALESVQGGKVVQDYLQENSLSGDGIAILAIGKAASAMCDGAIEVLGERIDCGLVITKDTYPGCGKGWPDIECMFASHPVPDVRSLIAGDRLITWLNELPLNLSILVLISGGTSSLVEKLPEGVELNDLQKLTQWLLASGLPIEQMNAIRSSVSIIKGGKLLNFVGDRPITQLLLSDVPADDPAIIGSGLFSPKIKVSYSKLSVPHWLASIQSLAEQTSDSSLNIKARIESIILATNKMACEAAKTQALADGVKCEIINPALEGDVHDCANEIMSYLETTKAGCYIWGGETTLHLPEKPGRGGRNQHLALLLAKKIKNHPEFYILCSGTDGTDGPTTDAGALVDASTVARGEAEGFDVDVELARANAGTFLAASGDLINTGPTGTNVMDLVIAVKVDKS